MNTDWEKLSPLQLGQFGEYYAKIEFASYGYDAVSYTHLTLPTN